MDIITAKALVSAILVFAVALFSIVSFRMGITHIVEDLKAGRKTLAVEGDRAK